MMPLANPQAVHFKGYYLLERPLNSRETRALEALRQRKYSLPDPQAWLDYEIYKSGIGAIKCDPGSDEDIFEFIKTYEIPVAFQREGDPDEFESEFWQEADARQAEVEQRLFAEIFS